jgi:PAS domain S-box-containing protein
MIHPALVASPTVSPLMASLQTVTEQLAAASTAEAVCGAVLTSALEALDAVAVSILLLGADGDGAEGGLKVAASRGEGAMGQLRWHGDPPSRHSPAGDALGRREALYFSTLAELAHAYPRFAAPLTAPLACAVLPMVLDGQGLGSLVVEFREPHVFTPEPQCFLRTLAAQCAVALGRVHLLSELEARVAARTADLEARNRALQEEGAALDAFVAYKESVGGERDVLALARQAIHVLRTSLSHVSAAYYELDGRLWRARVWSGDVSDEVMEQIRAGVPLDAANFAEVARTRAAVFADGWNAEANRLPSTEPYGAVALVPLMIGETLHSLFAVGTAEARTWTERERAIVRAVARGLGLTLERTEHLRQLAQERTTLAARTAALEAFAELTRDLSLSADPYSLIERAEATVLSLLPPGYAAFWEVQDGRWHATRLTGDVGSAQLQAVIDAGLPAGQTPTLDIPQRTRAPFYQDVYPQGADTPAWAVSHVNAVATLPVLVNGEVRGVFNVPLFDVRVWSEADRAVLETVVRSLGLALERLEVQRALNQTQHYLRVAAENAPILLFVTDAQGVFTLSEGRLLEQLGLRPGQAVGHSATALFAHEPDLREGRRLAQALAGEVAHDLAHLTRGGVTLESWFIPVKDSRGVVTEVVGVSLDVTERLATQRRIERANEALRRSNAELEQFAYVASHDLQEPLRTITSFSQLLTSKYSGQLDSRAETYVRLINEGTGRMAQLLQDLLAFARVTSGAETLVPVDTGAVLNVVLQDLHAQIERTGAQVEVGSLPAVLGDTSQLRQVFQNLIGNALKFSAPDRCPVIGVSAVRQGALIRFAVSDNGIGIAPEFFERIFTIFQRLHGREQYEGNGIGLSITRKIAQRHGGEVWLESTPGEGTTFFLTLPAASPEPG